MDNGAGGFSSPRTTTAADAFPTGLRVLVVDDDPTWLKILEKMLKKCSYEVTTCSLAREALNVLRERKDGFDIVISDVNMPDMDGFKLLEHVGLEMDLPVIMMSVDGETSRVMKGVQHGACDYLTKPVRMKELKNIWQHVLRKKIHEVKDTESYEASEDILMMRNGSDKFDDGLLFGGADVSSVKKRKDMESKENDDQDFNDPSALKRARVVWSVDLHQKFVNAVDQIGLDKVGPKKILDLMNVPWLTRENVASHLQKYRLYLSRIQKQNEPKTSCGGTKQQDFIPNDAQAGFDLPCSVIVHQENVASCNFGYSGNKLFVQDMNSNFEEGDLKSIVSFSPRIESRKALTGELPQKSSGSRTGLGHSLGSLGMDTRYTSFESTIPPQHSWNKEIRMMQFSQPPKQESELHGHTHLPHSGPQHHIQAERLVLAPSIPHKSSGPQHHIQPDCIELASSIPHRSSGPQQRIQPDRIGLAPSIPHGSSGPLHLIQPDRVGLAPSISHGSATTKREKMSSAGTKTLRSEYISNSARNISSRGHTNNPFSTHYETEVLNLQGFGPNTISTGSSSMKHPSLDQKSTSNWISDSQNLGLGSGSTLQSSQEVLQLCALQDYDSIQNVGLSHIEHLDYHDLELFEGLPGQSYDRMRLNCDNLCESMEYPIMDQGLFIV